jgi:serine/threonine-protein kinase
MNTLLSRLVKPFTQRRWFAGRYRLLRRLGAGGMAEVWLAQRDDGRAVAVKRILPHLTDNASVRLCFRDEARLGKQLRHRHLVRQLDHGYVGQDPFMVFEFIDGVSLRQLNELANGAGRGLPVGLCLRIAAEVAEALDAAHKTCAPDGSTLNLVHRDVSPDNILIDASGSAHLADFGVARADCNQRITANGSLCGKLAYMAPQQASAEVIDHRADQFSLGVVLFELFARRRLLADRTPAKTLGRILYADLPSITEVTKGLPSEVAMIIDRALARRPEERFADCAELAVALRDALCRFEACGGEVYDGYIGSLRSPGLRAAPLPLAAVVAGRSSVGRWAALTERTEVAVAAA